MKFRLIPWYITKIAAQKLVGSYLELSFQDLGLSSPLLKHMRETTLFGEGPPVWGMGGGGGGGGGGGAGGGGGHRPPPPPPHFWAKKKKYIYT